MITPRITYLASFSLIVILGASIPATMWFEKEIGETGTHGPVAIVAALPFISIFAAGAVILAVLVLRARMRMLPVAAGLLPFLILIGCGVLLFS
ncbi:MAG TPA: hypothetical protein VNN25_09810 [Thermoanaerobaculia bacterium]|nr:hypothetical protein [Thermoanaerobaculia bacterium]